MVELLAPAGSPESLHAAVNAGADAVYIGGGMFGARAYADNPGEKELLECIDYCHVHGRKIYMTVNTLLKEQEIEKQLYGFLLPYYRAGLDGVIVQDFGVVRYIQKYLPELPVHASTQMTVTGVDGARLLQREGLPRIVPARELSLEEIRTIIRETGIEVESFIHGAMCYCYSGQCLFSSMLGGRSGNRGRCAQPCRLPYQREGRDSSCLMSMKDMCALELLPEILDAGIASLKIEGRMKRPEYTAGVVSVYRKYIDRCLELGIGADGHIGRSDFADLRKQYRVEDSDMRILMDLYNRGGFTDGYYEQRNGKNMMSMKRPNHFGTAAVKIRAGRKGLRAVAVEPLFKGDVLELHDQPFEITLKSDVPEGGEVVLPKTSVRLKNGDILYRTRCELLLDTIHDRYADRNCKEKIKGALKICAGSPAILELTYHDEKVIVCSDLEAAAAQSKPIDEDAVRKQMEKTGNTPFEFEQLDIDLEKGLFMPVKELNELRRRGIEELTEAILSAGRREAGESAESRSCSDGEPDKKDIQESGGSHKRCRLNVSVLTEAQLNGILAVPDADVSVVYLDLLAVCTGRNQADADKLRRLADKVHRSGSDCYLNMPPVFRHTDRGMLEQIRRAGVLELFDGFLIHTVDELGYLREYVSKEKVLTADDTFYAYNQRAVEFLRDNGIDRLTFAAELNSRELGWLNMQGAELVVYGRQALMHSAQCVRKNTEGCTGVPELLNMRDRKAVDFPVQSRCVSCCSTVFNSVPLDLSGCENEIRRLAPDSFRLSFTVEDEAETVRVVNKWKNGIPDEPERVSTRGHFRRGVE